MGTYFADKKLLEAHLFDVDIDLYDQEITIYPLFKIRENKSFDGLDALVDQINDDMALIRNISWKVLTFGTFDHLHPGHESYLEQARAYGDALITIVALDDTVTKIKGKTPDHSQGERLKALQELSIPHHLVQLGDPDHVYTCIDEHSPEVIYLGYDQHSFDEGLIAYYT